MYDSNSFHLYDEKLLHILSNLNSLWVASLSYDEHFRMDDHGNSRYVIPMDIFPSKKAEEDFNELRIVSNDLMEIFQQLIKYVRNKYLEIDIDELSFVAYERLKAVRE